MQEEARKNRSIPSLDGLRAISVLAVILGHTESHWLDRIPFNSSFRNGGQGVSMFFLISGFLITHLLLKELNRDGRISLKKFYLRRTFRIFPPFYAFLAVIAVLGLGFHVVFVTPLSLLVAASYTWNYFWIFVKSPNIWILGHSWSLAVEEQFYLMWPLCMAYFSKKNNLRIAAGVILLSPISRIVTYFAWPAARGEVPIMLHTRLDTIMTGCLLALLLDMKLGERFTKLALHPVAPVLALVFLLGIDVPAEARWRGMYEMTVGLTLINLSVATLLLFAVFRHQSRLGKVLNWGPLQHIGMISYSLYLWQQLFSGANTRLFPLNIVVIFLCAELSFQLVEKPSFRLRDVVQRQLIGVWRVRPPSPVLAGSSPKDDITP